MKQTLVLVFSGLAWMGLAPPVLAKDPIVTEAAAAVAAKDLPQALDLFEQALTRDPDDLYAGADYRQAVIAAGAYDRCLAFFKQLVESHPEAANAWLNYGYAHVDRIPSEGAITQVILANQALKQFTNALERRETWLGLYTRGNSYLYWPAIFGRTPLAMADLEKAIELAKALPKRPYQARAWAALGDGHWRLKDPEKAAETWRQGLALFPGDPDLEARLARQGKELDAYLEAHFEAGRRVATDLGELREAP